MGRSFAIIMCSWAVALFGAEPGSARLAQEAAIAKQRAAIETMGQAADGGAVSRQMESIRSQMRRAGSLRVDVTEAPFETPACAPMDKQDATKLIREAADREGLTPDLLRAVIGKESSFRPCAVSAKGAMGLMQLMPGTAQQLGVMDPFDPKQNIDGGSRLLKQLLGRYGDDLTRALGAYNAGPGQVDRYGGLPPFSETVDYVTDILGRLRPKVAQEIQ